MRIEARRAPPRSSSLLAGEATSVAEGRVRGSRPSRMSPELASLAQATSPLPTGEEAPFCVAGSAGRPMTARRPLAYGARRAVSSRVSSAASSSPCSSSSSPSSSSGISPRSSSTRRSSATLDARPAARPASAISSRDAGAGAAGAAGAAPGRGRALQDHRRRCRRPRSAASSITPGSRSPRRCSASPSARCSASALAVGDRPCAQPRPQPDAVDHRLADDPDPRHRADASSWSLRSPIGHAPALRFRKALISTYLSFFPVTVGMVKGLRSPDPIQLDLMRTYNASALADLLEAALAVVGAVPLRLDEGRDRGEPRRRHRRRAADRRGGRPRRAAAHRLLLRPDRADLGGAVRRRAPGRACWSRSSGSPSASCSAAWERGRHERDARRGRRCAALVALAAALALPLDAGGTALPARRSARARILVVAARRLRASSPRCRREPCVDSATRAAASSAPIAGGRA